MIEEKEEGFGCFGTIFLALFLSVLIAGAINNFGSEKVEFWNVFSYTFIVVLALGLITKMSAIFNNMKLKKASKIVAERIIKEEEKDSDTS
jgi:uncharacterized protein YybS (DUF2232 family)